MTHSSMAEAFTGGSEARPGKGGNVLRTAGVKRRLAAKEIRARPSAGEMLRFVQV